MTEKDVMTFEWILPASELEAQRQALQGVQLEDPIPYKPTAEELDEYAHAAFEPMLLLVGAIAIGFLAERIVDAIQNAKHGGIVIDRTGKTVRVKETPAIPRGTALDIGPDGVQQFDLSKPPVDIISAIKALLIQRGGK